MRIVLANLILLETLLTVDMLAQHQVRVVRNIDYTDGGNHADSLQKLDLYLPQNRLHFPVIISIHGGGLMQWDKQESAHVGYCFASAGIGTVVMNYRLSPNVMHPSHVRDAAAAFAWVVRHINEYGGDSSVVFIIGHSAGAYLAALLAFDSRYLAEHKLSTKSIRGVVPVSAFHYVERVAPDRPKTVWGDDSTKWPAASPAQYVNPEAPPVLLLYADGDESWRKNQNKEFAAALRRVGHSNVGVKEVIGRDHVSIWNNIKDGDQVSELIMQFVSRHLPLGKGN